MNSTIEDVPLALIRQTYSAFRIVHPSAEKAMERSLSIYGQLSPLVCAPIPDGLELIDGFKRLRAAETLCQGPSIFHPWGREKSTPSVHRK